MLAEQAAQLPLADAEAASQAIDVVFVKRAELDKAERARYGVRGAAPSSEIRRCFRTAAQTRPEPRFLRCRRRRVERHVLRQRNSRRTNRAAVDAGGLHAGEEPTVETRIALADCAIAGVVIEIKHRQRPESAFGMIDCHARR